MDLKGNVNEYVFKPGTTVEIPAELLMEMKELVRVVLEDNSESFYNDKYKYINVETNKDVKTVKDSDIKSGKVKKVFDFEASLTSLPKIYRKPLALRSINLQLSLDKFHMEGIEKGDAIHYTELENIKK